MTLDPVHHVIIKLIEKSNTPIFLTGKAGTGKTTFLHYLKSNISKTFAVVAATAVAAINAGGVTLHSFFQIPFGPVIPKVDQLNFNSPGIQISQEKAKILRCLDLLIVDEVSMVRADVLDYIDSVLRYIKGSKRPFGGIQLLMIGDLYQLPPVYQNDWPVLKAFYTGPYFFNSLVFQNYPLVLFELTQVYRQKDPIFIAILNSIRNGNAKKELLTKLNERYRPDMDAGLLKDYVTLTTHNHLVKATNQVRLDSLEGIARTFKATVTGDFPKEGYPTEEELILKAGALVMFIKNDTSGKKQYYNGRTATITSIEEGQINVCFLDDNSSFEVVPEIWQNVKYSLSESKEKISESNSGSFTQYPLRLAWAITIHKSQGLTFDKAIIDVDEAFAHGQTYVALSRCRNLAGMVLKEPVREKNILVEPLIEQFMRTAKVDLSEIEQLEKIAQFENGVIADLFDFTILSNAWVLLKAILIGKEKDKAAFQENIQLNDLLFADKINKIGEQFIRQELAKRTKQTLIWDDEELTGRLMKAGGYFLPKLFAFNHGVEQLHAQLSSADLPEDYYFIVNQVFVHLKAKLAGFTQLPLTKSSAELLQAIKNAIVDYRVINKNLDSKTASKEKQIENIKLYNQLIIWRENISVERQVPDYIILSEKAIQDITEKLPRSLNQLSRIKNLGEVKAVEFGEQILKTVNNYLGESDLFSQSEVHKTKLR